MTKRSRGRPPNKPDLSPDIRAKILAEKNSGVFTVENIAKTHNTSMRTVYNISAARRPEDVALSLEYKRELIEKAKLNVHSGLTEMYDRMFDREKTSLRDVTGAVKVSHDILRLETDQSTHNVATASPLESLLAYVEELRLRGFTQEDIAVALDGRDEIDGVWRDRVKGLLVGSVEGSVVEEHTIEGTSDV